MANEQVVGTLQEMQRQVASGLDALPPPATSGESVSRIHDKLQAAVDLAQNATRDIRPEIAAKYKEKVNGFLLSGLANMDKPAVDAAVSQLTGDLDLIYAEMSTKVVSGGVTLSPEFHETADHLPATAPRSPDEPVALEELGGFEVPKIGSEEITAEIDGKGFDLRTPDGLIGGIQAVAVKEEGILQDAHDLSGKFEEAQETVQAAAQEVQEVSDSWIPGYGLMKWAGQILPGDSAQDVAKRAMGKVRDVYDEKMKMLEDARSFVDRQKQRFVDGAKFLVDGANKMLRESEKGVTVRKADAVKIQTEQVAVADVLKKLDADHETAKTGFSKNIVELQKTLQKSQEKLALLQKDLDRIKSEKITAVAESGKADAAVENLKTRIGDGTSASAPRLKEELNKALVVQEEKKRIIVFGDAALAKLEGEVAQEQANLSLLTGQKTSLESASAESAQTFESAMEAQHARKEALDTGLVQVQQEETGYVRLAHDWKKMAGPDGCLALQRQVGDTFHQFGDTNKQVFGTLEAQHEYLKKAEVPGYSLGTAFGSIPLVGKIGAMGILDGIGAGVEWVGEKTGIRPFRAIGSAVDAVGEWSKDKWGLSVIGGLATGTKDLVGGLYTLVTSPTQTLNGLGHLAANPSKLIEVGKALIQYDSFANGNIGYGLGRMIPDVLLLASTNGAGAAMKLQTTIGQKAIALGGVSLRAVAKAPWMIGKGLLWDMPGMLVKAPFVAIRGTGRLLKGVGKGLGKAELISYVRHGARDLERIAANKPQALKNYRDTIDRQMLDIESKYIPDNQRGLFAQEKQLLEADPRFAERAVNPTVEAAFKMEIDALHTKYIRDPVQKNLFDGERTDLYDAYLQGVDLLNDQAVVAERALQQVGARPMVPGSGAAIRLPPWRVGEMRRLRESQHSAEQALKQITADRPVVQAEQARLTVEKVAVDAKVVAAKAVVKTAEQALNSAKKAKTNVKAKAQASLDTAKTNLATAEKEAADVAVKLAEADKRLIEFTSQETALQAQVADTGLRTGGAASLAPRPGLSPRQQVTTGFISPDTPSLQMKRAQMDLLKQNTTPDHAAIRQLQTQIDAEISAARMNTVSNMPIIHFGMETVPYVFKNSLAELKEVGAGVRGVLENKAFAKATLDAFKSVAQTWEYWPKNFADAFRSYTTGTSGVVEKSMAFAKAFNDLVIGYPKLRLFVETHKANLAGVTSVQMIAVLEEIRNDEESMAKAMAQTDTEVKVPSQLAQMPVAPVEVVPSSPPSADLPFSDTPPGEPVPGEPSQPLNI